jgi:hypothetical protein
MYCVPDLKAIPSGFTTTPCYMPIGVYKKLATLNPENIPVNVAFIDI